MGKSAAKRLPQPINHLTAMLWIIRQKLNLSHLFSLFPLSGISLRTLRHNTIPAEKSHAAKG